MSEKPAKRSKGLVVHALPDETLVYDLDRDRALALNPTAALVFAQCDGKTTVDEIAAVVAKKLGVGDGEPLVALALDELARAALLEKEPGRKSRPRPIPRRQVLRHLKVGAALLPAVFSLLAPTAVSASSYVPQPQCNTTQSPLGCQAIFSNRKCAQPLPQKYCRSKGTAMASRSCTCR